MRQLWDRDLRTKEIAISGEYAKVFGLPRKAVLSARPLEAKEKRIRAVGCAGPFEDPFDTPLLNLRCIPVE
jgi:hypothetical protein